MAVRAVPLQKVQGTRTIMPTSPRDSAPYSRCALHDLRAVGAIKQPRGLKYLCLPAQGVSRLGSRGNMDVLRMLSRPQYSMTTRSSPTPAPPCGGAPNLNESMYDWIVSSGTPHSVARPAEMQAGGMRGQVTFCFLANGAVGCGGRFSCVPFPSLSHTQGHSPFFLSFSPMVLTTVGRATRKATTNQLSC